MTDREAGINNALHWFAFHLQIIDRMNAIEDSPRASSDQKRLARETAASSNEAFQAQRTRLINVYGLSVEEIRNRLPAFNNSVDIGRAATQAAEDKTGFDFDHPSDRRQGGDVSTPTEEAGLAAAIAVAAGIVNAHMQGREIDPAKDRGLLKGSKSFPIGYGAFFEVGGFFSTRLRFYPARVVPGGYWDMNPAAATKCDFRIALVGYIGLGLGLNSGLPGYNMLPAHYAQKLKDEFSIVAKVEGRVGFFVKLEMGLGVFGDSDPRVIFKFQPKGDIKFGSVILKLEFPSWMSPLVGLMHEALLANGFSDWTRYNSKLMYGFIDGFALATATFPIYLLESASVSQFQSNPLSLQFKKGRGSIDIAPHDDVKTFCRAARESLSQALDNLGRQIQEVSQDFIDSTGIPDFLDWARTNLF